MFLFWIALSWQFEPLYLISGVASSLLVAYHSHYLFIGQADVRTGVIRLFRFFCLCSLVDVAQLCSPILMLPGGPASWHADFPDDHQDPKISTGPKWRWCCWQIQ
jgi:hypothetical protein